MNFRGVFDWWIYERQIIAHMPEPVRGISWLAAKTGWLLKKDSAPWSKYVSMTELENDIKVYVKESNFGERINLKPSGYVIPIRFYIQQLYILSSFYLCVLYLSENKQRLVPLTS
jgi:hypothetical protein